MNPLALRLIRGCSLFAACGAALAAPAAEPAAKLSATVELARPGPRIAPGFTGLSFEVALLMPSENGQRYFRPDNQPLIHLFRTLGIKNLRIGGNTSDRDAKALPGPADWDSLFAFAQAADVKVMYCLRLFHGDPQVDAQTVKYILDHYADRVECFSIGQEPAAYPVTTVDNRPASERMGGAAENFTYADYARLWRQFADAIIAVAPNVKFCGPSIHNNPLWARQFMADFGMDPHVVMITEHLYPGGAGGKVPTPEIGRDEMLGQSFVATQQKLYDGFVPQAAALGLPYRLEEVNNFFNGGAKAVSDTFAAAIWGVDFLYWWAEHRAAGINFHTGDRVAAGPNLQPSIYTAFFSTRDGFMVRPLGYGIKAFELGAHGHLLPVTLANPDGLALTAHATIDRDGTVYVTLINQSRGAGAKTALVDLRPSRGAFDGAQTMALTAPKNDLSAHTGIRLGAGAIDANGNFSGTWTAVAPAGAAGLALAVPAGSALVVKVPASAPVAYLLGPDLLVVPEGALSASLPGGIWQPLPPEFASAAPALGYHRGWQLRLRPGAIVPVEAAVTQAAADGAPPLKLWISLDERGEAEGAVDENGFTVTYRAAYRAGRVVLWNAGGASNTPHPRRRLVAVLSTDTGTVRAEGFSDAAVELAAAAFPGAYADGRPAARHRLAAQDEGIVMAPANGPDQCDIRGAREAVVQREGGVYQLFYDGAGPRGWLACRATSTDLRHWQTHGPVLDFGAAGSPDAATATSPWAIRDQEAAGGEGLWRMFYVGSKYATPPPDFIPAVPYVTLTATARTLAGPWQKDYQHIPFGCVPHSWRSVTASPGCLVYDHGEYLQYFSAASEPRPGLYKRTLGLAHAQHLAGPWQVDAQPLFSSEEQVENSSVYFEPANGWWFLFTNHLGGEPLAGGGIGEYTDAVWVYWSKDPRHWDAEHKAVVLDGANSRWAGRCIGMPSVIPADGKLALLYDACGGWGRSNLHRSIGLAWLPLPLLPPS